MNGPQPLMLSPLSPSELLQYLISETTYPTTVIIAWPREVFVNALKEDIGFLQEIRDAETPTETEHPLLRASLLQTAVSRHINIVFIPTVTHLRVYLGIFRASEIRAPAPPSPHSLKRPAILMVYGLLELHRDGTEWSAQGLGMSSAMLLEAALRDGYRAVIAEPRRTQDLDELDQSLRQRLPVLTGTPMKDDGSWGGPTVTISRVLNGWFKRDANRQDS